MSATTATTPWDGYAETLIRESAQHVYTVRCFTSAGTEITGLYVTTCTVRMDEYWSPYLQATVTIVLPDAATLALLDPRLRVTVQISAGYVLPGGLADTHLIGAGYLARRTLDLPENQVTLEVAGAEYLVDGWLDLDGNRWIIDLNVPMWNDTTEARDAVTRALIVSGAITGTATGSSDPRWDYAGALTTTKWANPIEDAWVPGRGDSAMDIARDIAGRISGWFRCDELGIWRLTPRPVTTQDADVVHFLRVGADGTLISSGGTLSREGWANAVMVTYSWGSSAAETAEGYAEVTTGIYAVGTVGTVVHAIELGWKANDTHAYNRAQASLKQRIGLGFAYTVDAVAAYWVRPGDLVTLDLGVEAQQLAFVSSVAFDLDTGRMSLTTRQPVPANTF